MTDSKTDSPDQRENIGFNVISLQAEEFVLHPLSNRMEKKLMRLALTLFEEINEELKIRNQRSASFYCQSLSNFNH